jgi:hypothetical protein
LEKVVNSFTPIRVLAGTKKLAQNTTINTMVSFRGLQRRGFYSYIQSGANPTRERGSGRGRSKRFNGID